MISIVVPLYNEEDNIEPLISALKESVEQLDEPNEIILVDDGSHDSTATKILQAAENDPTIKSIILRRNYGQTAAMMAAFQHASGDVVISMDGDLQNKPSDIPILLEKLDEGYDVVSGWRKNRYDAMFSRVLPSKIANGLISWISGVKLHDFGCSLKAYRKETLEGVRLYGEMHRFIPIFTHWEGGKIAEVVVEHESRKLGASKYGLGRIPNVILDIIFLKLFGTYGTRPIHVFGGFGLVNFAIAFLAGVYALYLKYSLGESLILTPLPLLVVFTTLIGFLSILIGFMSELIVRVYYESQDKPVYQVKSLVNFESRDE